MYTGFPGEEDAIAQHKNLSIISTADLASRTSAKLRLGKKHAEIIFDEAEHDLRIAESRVPFTGTLFVEGKDPVRCYGRVNPQHQPAGWIIPEM